MYHTSATTKYYSVLAQSITISLEIDRNVYKRVVCLRQSLLITGGAICYFCELNKKLSKMWNFAMNKTLLVK